MEGSPALNRVRWAQSGREVAVGDSEGQVHVYEVGEVRMQLKTVKGLVHPKILSLITHPRVVSNL